MTEILDRAVGKMLIALGTRAEPERIDAFTEAWKDVHGCEECGVKAARSLSATMKRRPMPADFVEEAREVQASAEHQSHVADHAALGPGSVHVWWTTEAPVHIRKAWPELSGAQAVEVAAHMEAMGCVPPNPEAIAVELGWVDEYGPTIERRWWHRAYPELAPAVADPRVPRGDA